MKTPSISVRHLLGGFLGSVSGILISGYTKPHSVALACLGLILGTIAGYLIGHWYDEIANECTNAHNRFRLVWQKFNQGRLAFVARITCAVSACWTSWTTSFGTGLKSLSPILYWIGKVIIFPFKIPVYLCRWLFGRPVRTIVTLKVLTLTFGPLCLLILSYLAFPTVGNPGGYDRYNVFGLIMLFTLMFLIPLEEQEHRVNMVRRYSEIGTVRFVGKEVVLSFLRFIMMALYILGVCCVFAVGVPLFIIVFLGNMLIGGVLWGLWKVTFRKGYLLGLTVTLAITVTSAIINWDHLHGFLLWTIALGTGVVSGVLSEGVRRVFARILPRLISEKIILDDAFETVELLGKLAWRRTRSTRKQIFSRFDRIVSSSLSARVIAVLARP